jgi:hypothetical protein
VPFACLFDRARLCPTPSLLAYNMHAYLIAQACTLMHAVNLAPPTPNFINLDCAFSKQSLVEAPSAQRQESGAAGFILRLSHLLTWWHVHPSKYLPIVAQHAASRRGKALAVILTCQNCCLLLLRFGYMLIVFERGATRCTAS